MAGRSRKLQYCVPVVLGAVAALQGSPAAMAQPALQARVAKAQPAQVVGAAIPPVAIELSAPITNLFSRAEEGIAREDWKFAIDSLQRIIDDPGGGLLRDGEACEDGGTLYASARTRALRRLAELPPEALQTYRLLYDGKAQGLVDRAASAHDAHGLRVVVARYLLTQAGDDAADLLASWAIDEGRPAEAIACLRDLLAYVRERDVPDARIRSKLAAAEVLLGRRRIDVVATPSAYASEDASARHQESMDEALAVVSQRLANATHGSYEGHSWPVVGGSLARLGWMAETAPTLVDPTPWHFTIPDMPRGIWDRMYRDSFKPIPELPTSQLVANDGRLFVRMPGGVAALNLKDLSPLWTSLNTDTDKYGVFQLPHYRRSRLRMAAEAVFEDYVVGSLTVAHDLVLTVERGPKGLESRAAKPSRQIRGRRTPAGPTVTDPITRIVAYDAATGGIRWSRGRQPGADHPLGQVEFRAPLIPVGNELWGVYFHQDDLYAGALDPEDGSLIQSVLLGTVQDRFANRAHSLYMAAEAGLVFIPTGHGVLFAVDARDRTIRWASQYVPDRVPGAPIDTADVPGWLPSPPIVTNGLVLLTPADRRELLAFDAVTGELVWTTPINGAAYMFAADHRRVWFGGRMVSCHSLDNGEKLWETAVTSNPTGRAVMSGTSIHVPIGTGLLTLDADSGETLAQRELPPTAAPPGNILCLGNAMYSYDPSGVRKYPDLEKMYPQAVQEFHRDETNTAAAIQLAQLELLRKAPSRALEVIDAPGIQSGDAKQIEAMAGIKVEALLRLADGADGPSDATLATVRKALSVAPTASDRIRCTLAMAHQLTSLARPQEAFDTLLALYLHTDAGEIQPLEDFVQGRASVRIRTRLQQLISQFSGAESKNVGQTLEGLIASAAENLTSGAGQWDAHRHLQAIASLSIFETAARTAANHLIKWNSDRHRYENSEYLLRAATGPSGRPDDNARSTMELCNFYEETQRTATEFYFHCLDGMAQRFGGLQMPSDSGQWLQGGLTKRSTIEDWVRLRWTGLAELASAAPIDPALIATHGTNWDDRHKPRRLGVPADPDWWLVPIGSRRQKVAAGFSIPKNMKDTLEAAGNFGSPRVCRFNRESAEVLDDRVVFMGAGDLVYCQRASDGRLLWHTRLKLPESFQGDLVSIGNEQNSTGRYAAADGQIGVFNGSEGLHGVGLLTGKRLWARPYDTPPPPKGRTRQDRAMAAKDGYLAAFPNKGRLSLLRMDNGHTIWERELRGDAVESVRMIDSFVMTVDRNRQRVHLYDRRDGRLIHQTLFRQPNPRQEQVEIVNTGGVLFGPEHTAQADGIIAVDLATGKQRWRKLLNRPLTQLFVPAEGYLGVCMVGGELQIWDARLGEILIDRRIAGASRIVDGMLLDGTLLVQYINQQQKGPSHPGLVAIDIATGNEVWVRDDLADNAGPPRPLQIVGGYIPTLIKRPPSRGRKNNLIHLTLVDARTGIDAGRPVPLGSAATKTTLNGDFHVWSGGVIIGALEKIAAFTFQPLTIGPVEDS